MSVERMRLPCRLDTVNNYNFLSQRQQITPDIRFTCDRMITKWIVGANMAGGSFNPELQVWRNIGNDVYQKINGDVQVDLIAYMNTVISLPYHSKQETSWECLSLDRFLQTFLSCLRILPVPPTTT